MEKDFSQWEQLQISPKVVIEEIVSKLKEIFEPKETIFGCPIIVIPKECLPKNFLFALVARKDLRFLGPNDIYLVYSENKDKEEK